ncbi:hypothetical protein V500_07328 [Pseudogymnoascus sp. VKM F-4518 (FW-2643)]|nr:hypothetical protein V500_07328 [Pseudogymnoascus sp. VKM F-4518 (FW-2643)]
MTLSLLAFHATCNIYDPRHSTSLQSSPSHLPLVTLDHVSIDELDLRLIQSSISDLSESLSQINASLASLHEMINCQHPTEVYDEVLRKPQCHQHLGGQATDAGICGLIGFMLLIPFLGGIFIFLLDASNVSNGSLISSILLFLGSANAGLAFMLLLRGYWDGMWYDYALSMTWPIVISGFLVSPENSRSGKLAIEAEKAAKE